MPRTSSNVVLRERPNSQAQSHWHEIGNKAVAAASICKAYQPSRPAQSDDARRAQRATHLPLDDDTFATD